MQPIRVSRNVTVIYAAAFLRSTGIGMTGVLLGVYLARMGFGPFRIGLVIAAGLAGAAAATAVVSLRADRLGRRRALSSLAVLAALGGAGLGLSTELPAVALVSFLGMLNGMGTDRGPAFALEQAVLPQLVDDRQRTWVLSGHAVTLDAGHALGALAAGLPLVLHHSFQLSFMTAYRSTFAVYAGLQLLAALAYAMLSPQVEADPEDPLAIRPPLAPKSRHAIRRLAGLSAVDSLGGGFLTDALMAYWFFRRFGIHETSLGVLFFAGHLLNSISYLFAAGLARRFGLLNTMVFTHIPSSLFLMAVPLAPSFVWASGLFLVREFLVEMDVPSRQSYILAVVQPSERTLASGATNLARNVSRAVSPAAAGIVMQQLALAAPLFLGGGIKIIYDLLLYASFRRLKPPKE